MTGKDPLSGLMQTLPVLGQGHVWLTGAGPGDPGLLTLQAVAGLAQADVIVHDALVDARVLALRGAQARTEFAGKRGGKPSAQQDDITQRLIALARDGKRVLRLKGGDPCVFGRGGEEALMLARAGIPFRIVPGVTAGLAALTVASIPATMRGVNRAVILVTGHGGPLDSGVDWAALAQTGQPIVLYMALANLEHIVGALMAGGLAAETPAAVIASATYPEQCVLVSTLGRVAVEAKARGLEAPAIIAIGGIVAERGKLMELAPQLMEMAR